MCGSLTTPESLGLILFTDGVPLWKSSSRLWPIYLAVANLSPNMRMRKDNLLLSAVWVGEGKPNMEQFLRPTVPTLNELEQDGVVVKTASGVKIIRASLLCAVFDLVAKTPALNMKQFNGYYGCSVCAHPVVYSGRCITYPPGAYHCEHMPLSLLMRKRQNLQTQLSVVYLVLQFYLAAWMLSMVCELHCVLEGMTKWLLQTWVNSRNHRQLFYLGRNLEQIDKILLEQHPPHNFTRPLRSIAKHLSYWKASEFRTWLLYYLLPVLPTCFHHCTFIIPHCW